ncbi:uncharacterized protein JCM15063_003056 [Sporobolomyces koalae]|uniref:uncharacterized protein n=1 Tax=Sporobolomyces koalae TaxID=500713 RepID=UPI0031826A6A
MSSDASDLSASVGTAPEGVRPAWKDISYGSAAGIVSKLFEHPFDLVKVRLQSQPLDRPLRFKGPLDCMIQTFKGEGLRGLWRGVSMPVGGAMAENATLFVVYNQSQALLRHLFPPPAHSDPSQVAPLSIPQIATAAAIAGSAASFVLTPVELVKCKMQVQNIVAADALLATSSMTPVATLSAAAAPRTPPPGPVAITRSILRESGIKGLWLGQTGTFLRETGGSAAWFTTFEVLSTYFAQRRTDRGETSKANPGGPVVKGDLAAWELMLSGASAGVVYNCVLFPADCIKSTIQTEDELRGSALKAGEQRRGFLQVGKDIYKARGIRGLYSGCGLTAMRAAPSSALIFYIYSRLESIFG